MDTVHAYESAIVTSFKMGVPVLEPVCVFSPTGGSGGGEETLGCFRPEAEDEDEEAEALARLQSSD